MMITPTRVGLVAALAFALGAVWYYEGRGRWRARLTDRFVLGVPWGTLVTVAVAVRGAIDTRGERRSPVVFLILSSCRHTW